MALDARSAEMQRCVDDVLHSEQVRHDLIDRCVALAHGVHPSDEDGVATVLSGLVNVATHVERISGAEHAGRPLNTAADLALATFRETSETRFVLGLARQLAARGWRGRSVSLLEQADALAKDGPLDSDGLPPAATFRNLRGDLLRVDGQLHRAQATLEAALTALDDAAVGDHPLRSAVCNNLGLVRFARGDLGDAKTLLLESLRIDELWAVDPRHQGITLDNLGTIEMDLARKAGLLRGTGYVNAYAESHLDQADEYFRRAIGMFETGLPDTAEDYTTALLNAADLAELREDVDRFDDLTGHAAALLDRGVLGDELTWLVVASRGAALMARRMPRHALDFMAPWFNHLLSRLHVRDVPTRGLPTLLEAAVAVGDHDYADRIAAAMISIDDAHLDHHLVEGSEAEVRQRFAPFIDRARLILGHCGPLDVSSPVSPWLYDLVLNRKGVLAERQGSAWLESRRAEGANPELLRTVRELRTELARLDLDGSDLDTIQAARRRHADVERRLGQAEAQLVFEIGPGQAALPQLTVDTVQDSLGPDTVLLDFMTARHPGGIDHYLMFVVHGDRAPVAVKDVGPVIELDEALKTFAQLYARPPADDQDVQRRANTWRTIAPRLFAAGDRLADHIIVAPTGVWASVPFCLLPDAAGRPLVDGHVVSSVPSARWIVTHNDTPSPAEPGPPVVLGDPDFDLSYAEQIEFYLSRHYPTLAHTRAEAEQVARVLGVDPLTGQAATRQRLLDVARPRILHIATHGEFIDAIHSIAEASEPRSYVTRNVGGTVVTEEITENEGLGWSPAGTPVAELTPKHRHRRRVQWLREIGPANQLSRSALLLTGCNAWLAGVATPSTVGTGMVTAGEFALLDLRSTALVVLSACQTGAGAVDFADGSLIGLRTAAIAAGASCCVSSLWQVGDAATALLMSSFYQELSAGSGPGTALRAAQQALRTTHPDPYFWAAWVADGATPERLVRSAGEHANRTSSWMCD